MQRRELVESYHREAERWLAEGRVADIEFAGRTYQVQVINPSDEEYWPFLQFGEDEELADAFCTCHQAEQTGACPHLAAALLGIYRGQAWPLHVRYRRSLWNQLCTLFGQREGYAPTVLTKEAPGQYGLTSVTGKSLFSIHAQKPEAVARLEALIDQRIPETEENSLKFSGLSAEELAGWREGKPSLRLQYELSFWSDLAKWLMLHQEQGVPYAITFSFSQEGLPNLLRADFDAFTTSFYLSRANLAAIIPTLKSVDSPLAVYQAQADAVGTITYNRQTASLHIGEHETPAMARGLRKEAWHQTHAGEHLVIDGWIYAPGDGFYAGEKHDLIHQPVIPKEQIGSFLNLHAETVALHLVSERIHKKREPLHFELWFDADWQLHIRAYLFSPGDLTNGTSCRFDGWVYLEDDGFHPTLPSPLPSDEQVITESEVSEFVHRNRIFLGQQPGFSAHLSAIEASLRYGVDTQDALCFSSGMSVVDEESQGHEFGDWLYVPQQGFFAKEVGQQRSAVRAGVKVPKGEVPLFVRANREELELVEGFFADICPVADVVLDVALTKERSVRVTPNYRLHPEIDPTRVRYFGEYVYVLGQGFSQLPRPMLPPERFRSKQVLSGQELHLFLTYELAELLPKIGRLDPRLRQPKRLGLVVSDVKGAVASHGMATLNFAYQSDLGLTSLAELWRAQAQRQRHVFTNAGLLDLEDPRFRWLRGINPSRFDRKQNALQLSNMELMRLAAEEHLECVPDASGASQLLETLTTFRASQMPDISSLNCVLRPYQDAGLHWLWFLYSQALSGLLCDDMGLGKTHQAMALMAAINHAHRQCPPGEQPHYLVVCPTSVLYHWREKLERFLPDVRVHLFHGPKRFLGDLMQYDLLLTSYGVFRSERSRLSQIGFELAILDEIQVAKNPSSRTHKALSQIRASMYLGLTGTPIENNLRDLRSLFDLILPGYLPIESQFREQYAIPIEKEGDLQARDRLQKIVRPFVLRRKKEEVLTELPDKTEERAHCELSPQQATLYHQVLTRSRADLLSDLEDDRHPISYTHIFSVLTALKRICDHPAVYLKAPGDHASYQSGKWDLFCALLAQARDSQQKVVVFSQYLDMLDIIELYLQHAGIGYAAIRGATIEREAQLRRFATDPHCEVFVGSLGAAGLGIDLTAASVVIHYDRWWTKARESQATDRVYRIGQTRGVQVFKLVTAGTLEERIDAIIERKGALMDEVIGADDAGQLKTFTRDELIALLAEAEQPDREDEGSSGRL